MLTKIFRKSTDELMQIPFVFQFNETFVCFIESLFEMVQERCVNPFFHRIELRRDQYLHVCQLELSYPFILSLLYLVFFKKKRSYWVQYF